MRSLIETWFKTYSNPPEESGIKSSLHLRVRHKYKAANLILKINLK